MAKPVIHVEATISAERTKVWALYTSPEHITGWNFASPDWRCPHAVNELKPGGSYRARMEARDGSFGFDFEAVYEEVVPYERLTYTIADGRSVTISFEDQGGRTRLSTAFEAEKQNPEEMQREGWQAILDNFKRYAEAR